MTTPGSDGTAFVDIVANVDNFERDLARALKRIAKEQGQLFGDRLGQNFLIGFRRRLRADLPKYATLGAQAGRAVRKGFEGEKFGRLAAQDFLRGVRRGLRDANVRGPNIAPGRAAGSAGGEASADLAAFRAGLKERELALRASLAQENAAFEDSLRQQRESRRAAANETFRESLAQARANERAELAALRAGLKENELALRASLAQENAAFQDSLRQRREDRRAEANETFRETFAQARANERAELVALRAGLKEREIQLRASLASQRVVGRRDGERLGRSFGLSAASGFTRAFGNGIRALTQIATLGLRGRGGVAGLAASFKGGGAAASGAAAGVSALALVVARAIPVIGNLFLSLRNATGALFGVFPAATLAAGALFLFQGENKRLEAALKPVKNSLNEVRKNLDGIAASAASPGFQNLAKNVIPQLQPGLEAFAERFGRFITGIVSALQDSGAAASFGRALDSIGQALEVFATSPGLVKFFRFLGRINEETARVLPAMMKRFGEFLGSLEDRFKDVDFGVVFERGIQTIVDFGAAVINLLRVLNNFFEAAAGPKEQGTFFSGLRKSLGDFAKYLDRPEVKQRIREFFNGVRIAFATLIAFIRTSTALARGFLKGFFAAFDGGDAAGKVTTLKDALDRLRPILFEVGLRLGQVAGFLSRVVRTTEELVLKLNPLLTALRTMFGLLTPLLLPLRVMFSLFKAVGEAAIFLAKVLTSVLDTAFRSVVGPITTVLTVLQAVLRAAALMIEQLTGKLPGLQQLVGEGAAAALRTVAEGIQDVKNGLRDLGQENTGAVTPKPPRPPSDKITVPGLTGDSTGTNIPNPGEAAKDAAKVAVDLTALLETISDRLNDALRRGGEATDDAFKDLRKTITSALKGTLQEGRTKAVLAFLESQRKGAIAAANSYAQISAAVDKTRERLTALKNEQNQFRQSVLDTLKASASIETFLSKRPGGGVASFTRFLTKDLAKLEEFQKNLASLLQKGLNPALVRDIAAGGIDNARFARKLAAATPQQIAAINKLQASIDKAAAGTANLTAATFQQGIDKVSSLLTLQLAQQKRQEAQLDRLARGIVNGIAAAVKGKPIPAFAKGGITNGPSLAGEAGRELVVPLQRSARSSDIQALLKMLGGQVSPQGGSRVVQIENQNFILPSTKADPRAVAREVDRRLASSVR